MKHPLALLALVGLLMGAGDTDEVVFVDVDGLASAEAAEALASSLDLGEGSARVFRRYRPGHGWSHSVQVVGIATPEAARSLAEELRESGHQVTLHAPSLEVSPRERPSAVPTEPVTQPRIPAAAGQAAARKAEAALRAAARAHRSALGEAPLEASPALGFVFTRELDTVGGRLVVRHDYRRQGDARRLEVFVEEGEGTSSTTIITTARRAVVAVGGELQDARPERTLETIERFSPESVLALPLGLEWSLESGAEWRGLELTSDGSLQAAGAREEGVVWARFDAESGLLDEVHWAMDGEVRVWRLTEWRPIPNGVVLPHHVEIESGGRILEVLRVESLEPWLEAPPKSFDLPDGVGH